jgi:predicted nucleic acid-binding protein
MIDFDFSKISKFSVIDTCAILNLLSSDTFYTVITSQKFQFCYTTFVEYEALYRRVKTITQEIIDQRAKLQQETAKEVFRCERLSIDDLQDVEILEARKKLGKGELSSIAFAKKINQPFMTDDKKAKKLGEEILGKDNVLTSPRLLGWLYFNRILIDSDHKLIIAEHIKNGRKMTNVYNEIYHEAIRRLYS